MVTLVDTAKCIVFNIATCVMSLLNNSTAGYNDLQPSIMKMLTKVYIKPLTYLINISIKQGIFREELMLANVIPIYKSDDKQLIQNYIPI